MDKMVYRETIFVVILMVTFVAGCGERGGDVTTRLSSAKAITAFLITSPSATGIIDESLKTISVSVPYGTDITALIPTFTMSGASVKVGAAIQVSGTTANNFTSPVTYTVTAEDGTATAYSVTVTVTLAIIKIKTSQHDVIYDFDKEIYSVGNIQIKGLYKIDVKGVNYISSSFEPYSANNKITLNGTVLQEGFDGIAASVATNLSGDYAYSVSQDSVAQSFIVFNGSILSGTDDHALWSIVDMSVDYLLLLRTAPNFNEEIMYLYNISDMSLAASYKLTNNYLQRGLILNQIIYLQIFSIETMSQDIYLWDYAQNTIKPLMNTSLDEILMRNEGDAVTVATIEGNDNGKYLFNTYYNLLFYQLGEPFSSAPDFLGRLSWNESYRLIAMSECYKKNGDKVIEHFMKTAMKNILSSRNKLIGINDSFNPLNGWASKKYSLDKQSPNTLLVDNGMIAYSLLNACHVLGNNCPQDVKSEILKTGEELGDYYEQYFDVALGLYKIPYGSKFLLDGVWAPWNWQNIWACVLMQLAEFTGNSQHLKRAIEIRRIFLSETELVNNKLLWRYWPKRYYQGWSSIDNISVNTPTKAFEQATRYEDVSHAYISVLALSDLNKYDAIVMNTLQNTLDNVMSLNPSYPLYIDAAQAGSILNLPKFTWSKLNNNDLKTTYTHLVPYVYPDFESADSILPYIQYYNDSDSFQLSIRIYNCNEMQCSLHENYNYANSNDLLLSNPFFQTF